MLYHQHTDYIRKYKLGGLKDLKGVKSREMVSPEESFSRDTHASDSTSVQSKYIYKQCFAYFLFVPLFIHTSHVGRLMYYYVYSKYMY